MKTDKLVIVRGERIFFDLKVLNYLRKRCVQYSDELPLVELGVYIDKYNEKDNTLVLRGGVKSRKVGNIHTRENYREIEKYVGQGFINADTKENFYRIGLGLEYEHRDHFPYSILPKVNSIGFSNTMDALANVKSGVYPVCCLNDSVEVLLDVSYSLADVDLGAEKSVVYEDILSCSENNLLKYVKRVKQSLANQYQYDKLNDSFIWYRKFKENSRVYEQDLEEYLAYRKSLKELKE